MAAKTVLTYPDPSYQIFQYFFEANCDSLSKNTLDFFFQFRNSLQLFFVNIDFKINKTSEETLYHLENKSKQRKRLSNRKAFCPKLLGNINNKRLRESVDGHKGSKTDLKSKI